MQRLGLKGWQWRAYLDTLATTHERRIRVTLLTLDHEVLREFEPRVLEGQVTVDVTQSPSRVLNLTIVDPNRTLGFEGKGDEIGTYLSRMIQVTYRVNVPTVGWVPCSVFCGPITNVKREDSLVTIEASGKERLAMGAQWKQRNFKKKTRKAYIIRELLGDAGEKPSRMAIPWVPATTPNRTTVLGSDKPWRRAKAMAKSMGKQLFYDGRGFVVMRRQPKTVQHTFGVGAVVGPLTTTREDPNPPNTWVVQGPKPKGNKKRVTSGPVSLPDSHPLSAKSRSRNGRPFRVVSRETNPQVKTVQEAKFFAYQKRENAERGTAETSVDVLPMPCLDEMDLVRVRARTASGYETRTIRLKQLVIPLADGPMGLGTTKRTGDRFWTSKKPKSLIRRQRRAARKKAAKKAAAKKSAAPKKKSEFRTHAVAASSRGRR